MCSSGPPSTRARRSSRSIRTATSSTTARSDYATDRDTKADTTLELEHGKPLIFGKNRDKGIRLNGMEPEVVELGKGITEDDLLFHDEKAPEPTLAYLLSRMRHPEFPEPIGVFRCVDRPRYDEMVNEQIEPGDQRARRRRFRQALQLRRHLDVDGASRMIICPYCEAENIEGADECGECSQPLMRDEHPRAGVERRGRLAADRIERLWPKKPSTVPPDTPVGDVLKKMVGETIGCVMVVDDGKLVGIFSERDALMKLNIDAAKFFDQPISQFMTPAAGHARNATTKSPSPCTR